MRATAAAWLVRHGFRCLVNDGHRSAYELQLTDRSLYVYLVRSRPDLGDVAAHTSLINVPVLRCWFSSLFELELAVTYQSLRPLTHD